MSKYGSVNSAVLTRAGILEDDSEEGDLDDRLRQALIRLEDRKARRDAARETAPIPYNPNKAR